MMRFKLGDFAGVTVFGIVLFFVSWRCWTFLRPENEPHHPRRSAMCDFQDVVYYPARAALAGINPYDSRPPEAGGVYFARFPAGNNFPLYAPLIFVVALPFALLPLVPAEIVYGLFNVGLLLLFSRFVLRIGRFATSVGAIAGLAALLLLSRPGHANFYFGAITLPMALATAGAWWLADRRPWLSAVCLAIAFIKPTFGAPLFFLMLLRGNYRAALGGVGLAAVSNIAVLCLFLPHDLISGRIYEVFVANQAVTDADPAVDPLFSSSRIDFPMVFERFWGHHLPGGVRLGIGMLVLLIASWHLRLLRVTRPVSADDAEMLSTSLACLSIVLCVYHNIYDALMVAIPAVAAWGEAKSASLRTQRWLAWGVVASACVVAFNYLSSKQFLALLGLQSLMDGQFSAALWTAISTLNGICLTIAWGLLLARTRSEIGRIRQTVS
jgi:Glycosyltransferase family 87